MEYFVALLLGVGISLVMALIVVLVGDWLRRRWSRQEDRIKATIALERLAKVREDAEWSRYVAARDLIKVREDAEWNRYLNDWTHEEVAPGIFHPVRPEGYRGTP